MTITELKESCLNTLRVDTELRHRDGAMFKVADKVREKHELILKLIEEHESHVKDKGMMQVDLAQVIKQNSRQEVVRCKDCKHYRGNSCEWHNGFKPPVDWFCADGERE